MPEKYIRLQDALDLFAGSDVVGPKPSSIREKLLSLPQFEPFADDLIGTMNTANEACLLAAFTCLSAADGASNILSALKNVFAHPQGMVEYERRFTAETDDPIMKMAQKFYAVAKKHSDVLFGNYIIGLATKVDHLSTPKLSADVQAALDTLNFYRNQYYTEPSCTEQGEVAQAINTVLPLLPATAKKEL